MQKFFSQALCAVLLMGACITDAAVPTVQDAAVALRQTSSFSTQISSFHRSVRQDVVQALSLSDRVRPSTRADESEGTNTALMLVGALAIMAVMVRRRWNSRD